VTAVSLAFQLVGGAIVGVVATVVLQDRLESVVLRLISRTRRGPRHHPGEIEGVWLSVFWHRGIDGPIRQVVNVVRIRRVGKRMRLDTIHGNNRYRAAGTVEVGRNITCFWKNTKDSSTYSGTCQFIVAPEGDALSGLWSGWNKKGFVSSGPWILVRLPAEIEIEDYEDIINTVRNPTGTQNAIAAGLTSKLDLIAAQIAQNYHDANWRDVHGKPLAN
jgi:hypothetical protein